MADDTEDPDDSSESEGSSDESSDESSSSEGGEGGDDGESGGGGDEGGDEGDEGGDEGGGEEKEEEKEEEDPKDKSGYGKEWKPADRYKYVPGKGWEEDKEAEEEGPERKVTIYQHSWGDKSGYIGGIDKEGKTEGEYGSGKAGIGLFYGKAEAASELSYDLNKKEANLTLITAKAQISVVHAEAEGKFKLGAWISSLFSSSEDEDDGDDESDDEPEDESEEGQAQPGMAGMGALMAARVGDLTSHGSPLFPGIGSTNVFIGNMPAWRTLMDFHACPVVKGIIPDVGGVVLMGSPTVFINFMMACRIADFVVEIPGGPNAIAIGCPTVFIGSGGGGGGAAGGGGGEDEGGGEEEPESEGVTVQGKASGDLLTAGAEANVGIVFNKEQAMVQAKASAMAAVAKGSIEGGFTIPLWGTHSITIGAGAEGSYSSAGLEGHAEAGYNKEKGYHASAGLGAALGAGGALNFSVGFK